MLNYLLTGGVHFDDSEEYLQFRFAMLNAFMLTGVLFTALFIVVDWLGINSLGPAQLGATIANCALTAALFFALRGRKRLYGFTAQAFVAINYGTFFSALVLVGNDELRVIWFFVEVVVVYILIGLRAGVCMTVLTLLSIVVASIHFGVQFSRNAMTTLLIALSATSVISYAYTRRAISYFERLRQSRLELQELAETDMLTGLFNPRTFYDMSNRLIWLAQRTGSPYSVLFLDLDHFKAINDDYGHETGDIVLRAVAECLDEHMRHTDVLGRVGGEEFAVFLPGTGLSGALLLAEKLRVAVQDIDLAILAGKRARQLAADEASGKAQITVCVGVSDQQPFDTSIADVLRRADRAMYRAKHAGRNRVASETYGASSPAMHKAPPVTADAD